MQKKHAFEVIPRALVKTVRFPEGQAYENVQDAVFGTAYALAMRLKERLLECYSVDLLVNYHDVFGDGKQSYYDAIVIAGQQLIACWRRFYGGLCKQFKKGREENFG